MNINSRKEVCICANLGSVNVTAVGGGSVGVAGKLANVSPGGTALAIFIDGVTIEIFANGGERSLTHVSSAAYVEGGRVRLWGGAPGGAPAAVRITAWSMARSIS